MRSLPVRRLLVLLSLTLALVSVAAACGGDDEAADAIANDASTSDGVADGDAAAGDDDVAGGTSDDGAGADGAEPAEDTTTTSGDGADGSDGGDVEELFPDVVGATAQQGADGSWIFSATLSSPYDTPDRYADAWRVVGPDGEVYGIRELAHDHANEQPFTRSQSGIEVPDGVTTVTVEGRDQVSGWGGATIEVELDG